MSSVSDTVLLSVEGLSVDFDADKPAAHRALNLVDLSLDKGEAVGLVGESGSGKTVLAHSILGLLPRNGRVSSGRILWNGSNLVDLPEPQLRKLRGKEIAMIFQDPQASLNPVYPVGKQIEWVLKLHRNLAGSKAKAEVLGLLESVQLRDPDRCYRSYAHELSGGMSQRVCVAMALACRPKLLIADEPTSALDVTIQAELADLLQQVTREFSIGMLFITHDLALAGHLCQRVYVMRAGDVVESGRTEDVFTSPRDSYTRRLIESIMLPVGTPARVDQASGNPRSPKPPLSPLPSLQQAISA